MKKVLSRRAVIATCIVLLLLFLVRPRAGRLRGRVSESLGQAVGRRVEISSLHLRIFPRPGFSLGNVIVQDNPAFGAEPLLRSADVTAWLRVSALLRGRLEISSLSLSDASVNLARDSQGKWNIEDLVERTSHSHMAPTGDGRRNEGPAFPYIEATRARINFKEGAEKTRFALTNAEFALWQESQETWGARLKASPIRTDTNLTDTGVLTVTGQWNRAARVHETPVNFAFEWKQAQIGQVSKLIYGADRQWRGGLVLSGTASGTPENLKVSADAALENFGRRDVLNAADLRLAAHCSAQLSLPERSISNLDCVSPSGAGLLEAKGGATGSGENFFSSFDFWLVGSKLPARSLLALAQHASDNFPSQMSADGEVNGSIEITRLDAGRPLEISGSGSFRQLQIGSQGGGDDVALGTVPFNIVGGKAAATNVPGHFAKTRGQKTQIAGSDRPKLVIGPVNLSLGRPTPLQALAALDAEGYKISLRGDAGIKRLLQLAEIANVPAPAVNADGGSTVDLTVGGGWSAPRAAVQGTAQLHSVKAQVRGLNDPVEIASASLAIGEDSVRVNNIVAGAAHATWRGNMQIPRPCVWPEKCNFEFNLHASDLNALALNAFVNPSMAKKSWLKMISLGASQLPFLLQAHASGKIAIDKLELGGTACSLVSADVRLAAGEVDFANLRGEIFGGELNGDLKGSFAKKPPEYSGSGQFDSVSLADVAALMHDAWMEGSGSATYRFTAGGWTVQDLLSSADLSADFTIRDGAFPHVVLTNHAGHLRTADFSGDVRLNDEKLSFGDAKLQTSAGVYKLSGTASIGGTLDLKLSGENAAGYSIGGTVQKTRVSSNPTAEAALKP